MRVLILDLDTLRPDHLGCYGYQRNTSPTIDKIASEGVRFDNYYCSDAPCLPSRAALVSGEHGIRSGIIGHGGTAADRRLQGESRGFRCDFSMNNLWTTFRNAGFYTASINPFAERHSAWWFNAGFNETINTGKGGNESAEEVTPVVLDWMDRNAEKDNWVLHINYWDPHTPYRAPAEFENPFAGEPIPEWMTREKLAEHRSLPGGHSAQEVSMFNNNFDPQYPRQAGEIKTMEDWRGLIDGYDCGIRYMDGHINTLMEKLEALGVLEDTAIIITSDHGENMGELNSYAEHGTSDNITHRIPMIIRMPGYKKGHVDKAFHYNLDLLPTIAELFDIDKHSMWQGKSYAETLKTGAESGHEALVLGQSCHSCMRSVRFDKYIYIRTYHDFYHLYPKEMLFDLENDPHEEHNLAEEKPELCAKAAAILLDWHDDMMAGNPDAVDPLWTVMREGGPLHSRGALPKYCERLEATGRGQYVEALKERHPYEFSK